jgi:hypothetical protein
VDQDLAVLGQVAQFVLYGQDKHDNSLAHKYVRV